MNDKVEDEWQHLGDVPVPVSIELGRTKLTLDEVANLKENVIIRLPRSTGEGIDIRAGEETLFRGEVIVIEDRAGVRINEIACERRK
ncbi:MAG: FliM/FliN family flagellar motor switch protein [Pyrinomonadaceae bacterium]